MDGNFGTRWTEAGFDALASGFIAGQAAIGYEDTPESRTNFAGEILSEIRSGTHAVYSRTEFDLEDASQVTALKLRLKYDNGFVAFLNGVPVASDNVPEDLNFFSTAPDAPRRDSLVLEFAEFDLSDHVDALRDGTNVLAIHLLNDLLSDRSDMLLVPQLTAGILSTELPVGYLPMPTPGAANIDPGAVVGPIVADMAESPGELRDDEDVVVTARFEPLNAAVASASLVYRVMYGNEVPYRWVDDGTGADATAGDGIHTATISHTASGPGQMLRWYVSAVDTEGNTSRGPHFLDRVGQSQSPQYQGAVIAGQTIDTQLPVFQWFVEEPRLADQNNGTRASFFYDGEFYDNIFVRIRGGTARSWPKRSYKVEFNDGQLFRFRDDVPRVDEINLNATYTDKSYMRSILTSELQLDAGTPSPESFHVRLHQNGEFFSVAIFVEQPDRSFLRRHGMDDNGSLYKGGPGSSLVGTAGLEKKTRQDEDNSDLRELIAGLRLSGDDAESFVFDNINIPAQINFMATNVVTQNIDASDKNYYLYRDTEGTGEWHMMPWDLDLTFGPDALNTDTILADETRAPGTRNPNTVHPLLGGRQYTLDSGAKFNQILDQLITVPRTREMLLRRIRTLTDQFLATSYVPDRIDELIGQIAPDVVLDQERWGNNAHFGSQRYTLVEANDRIKNEYLVPRVPFLTTRQSELTERQGGVGIPEAQDGNPLIVFGNFEFDPTSGDQDEEFIELVNPNSFSVDVSGWQLSGGIDFTIQPGTVIPAGNSLYVSPNVSTFRARAAGPAGGQGLFVQGGYEGHLSRDGESIMLSGSDGMPVQRTFVGGEPTQLEQSLRITEINFHPHAPNPVAGMEELDDGAPGAADRFEFVELTNIDQESLDLSGVQFTLGVEFTFPADTSVGPGGQVLVVRDRDAFESRYGEGLNVAGEFSGELADEGEHVFLDGPDQRSIQSFAYNSTDSWPARARGHGSSLEIIDVNGDYGDPSNWRASNRFAGSPRGPDEAVVDRVVFSEILASSASGDQDWVELHNMGGLTVDIGNWYVSDSGDDYFKFSIPQGTSIAPLGFHAIGQAQLGFGFDGARGGQLWLIAADDRGRPLRFVDGVSFGNSSTDVSLGPWPAGSDRWLPLSHPTFGQPNAGPRVGDVIISEVHFQPLDPDGDRRQEPEDFEFIELYNRTDRPIDIGGWQIDGATEFLIPDGTTIDPGQTLTIVAFDANDSRQSSVFRFTLAAPLTAALVGPIHEPLDDVRGQLRLLRPDMSPADGSDFIPRIVVDEVTYDSTSPWPAIAAGSGNSFSRAQPTDWGNFPSSWIARLPSPGGTQFVARYAGDSNDDGQFGASDLDFVLQAGRYMTSELADWSQGDWTGDGFFDQRDVVAALQSGGFSGDTYRLQHPD